MHTPKIDEELVKQVYFYCENNNPNGIYPSEIDLMEFAEKFAAVISNEIAQAEHGRCVRLARTVNRDVSEWIQKNRPENSTTEEDWSHHMQKIHHLQRHTTDALNDKKYNTARERLLEIEHECRRARSWIDAK